MAEETGQSSSQGSGTQSTQAGGSAQGSGSQSSQSGTTTQTSQGEGQTSQGQTQQTSQPTRPEYIPEAHWDATANKVKDETALSAHFNEIIARDAAEQSRKLSLPADPNAYKTELPTDFVVPQGVEYKFNDADPLLAQAKTLAHQLGIPQEGFSKLLGLYAGAQVAAQQQIDAARTAEVAKLGPTGPARVDAVSTVFKSVLGEAEGKQLISRMVTAGDIAIAEKLVAKLTQQGTFKGIGREPATPQGRVSEEQFSKMSPADRLNYTRQFDQSQFQQKSA